MGWQTPEMKTILFIDSSEKRLWDSFQEHRYLFEEFIRDGDLVVCDWRREGTSVRTSVPELPAALADDEEWCAIVACDLRDAEGLPRPEEDRFYANPFDFPENYDTPRDAPLEESSRPIIRLSQMLGGIPDRVALREATGDGVAINRFDIVHPRSSDHFDLLERYRLGVPRPMRMVAITPRDVDERLSRELSRRRLPDRRSEARRFWERNGYSAITRFVACDFEQGPKRDLMAELHTSSEAAAAERAIAQRQWLGYWLSVLTLSQAELEGDDLRPYELYRLEVEVDRRSVDDVLSARRGMWEASMDILRTRISLEQSLLSRSEYRVADAPDCTTHIPMEFDLVRTDHLQANPEVVGMFRDIPANDVQAWLKERRQSREALRDLLYAPRRGLRNAVTSFHRTNTIAASELEYCILNVYETERLKDEVEEEELRLTRDLRANPLSFEHVSAPIERQDGAVRESIELRSSRASSVAAIAVAVATCLLGASHLLAGEGANAYERGVALMGALVGCASLGVCGLVTIRHQRQAVRRAYRRYNEAVIGIYDRMRNDMDEMGKRLSRFATFGKQWAILERQRRRGLPTEQLVWLRQRQTMLRKRLELLDGLSDGAVAVDRSAYRRVMSRGWEALREVLDDDRYYLPYEVKRVWRPLNREMRLGKEIMVPFAFISNVSLCQQTLDEYEVPVAGEDAASGEADGGAQ